MEGIQLDMGYITAVAGMFIQRRSKSRLDPLSLLSSARPCECSDQRDKVYAVLGLMKPIPGYPVTPSYDLSPQELFIAVANMVFEGDRLLIAMLAHVSTPAIDARTAKLCAVKHSHIPS